MFCCADFYGFHHFAGGDDDTAEGGWCGGHCDGTSSVGVVFVAASAVVRQNRYSRGLEDVIGIGGLINDYGDC